MPQTNIPLQSLVPQQDATERLATDLEDTLKDYDEKDLIVELLQNSLDILDEERYKAVCEIADLDPSDEETITLWNRCVDDIVEEDYQRYAQLLPDDLGAFSVFYQDTSGQQSKTRWWDKLCSEDYFNIDDRQRLETCLEELDPKLVIRVSSDHNWIEFEDNGGGMGVTQEEIVECFSHQSSSKRAKSNRTRRRGTRGAHGWGLTACLGMTNRLVVSSRKDNSEIVTVQFTGFKTFARDTSNPGSIDELSGDERDQFIQDTLLTENDSGTIVRIYIADANRVFRFGQTWNNYNDRKFINYLRLLTPLGQVNDYVHNPAYHIYRKDDFTPVLINVDTGIESNISYDYLRLSNIHEGRCFHYNNWVNDRPHSCSVHTISRYINGEGLVILSGAEIQQASFVANLASRWHETDIFPSRWDATKEQDVSEIPRGFYLAFSGGMLSTYKALEPTGNNAMFRGVLLSEKSPPTLARRHMSDVLDGRSAVSTAASRHTRRYNDLRIFIRDEGDGGGDGAPNRYRRRRILFEETLNDLRNEKPERDSLSIWAGEGSGEARVMLLYAELLAKGFFGNCKVIKCGLSDQYDFLLYQKTELNEDSFPKPAKGNSLSQEVWASYDEVTNTYQRYAICEFKTFGHAVFDDFGLDENDPKSKDPQVIDLLVCWDFDLDGIDNWESIPVNPEDVEFQGQTHRWENAAGGERNRPMAVINLKNLLENHDWEDGQPIHRDSWVHPTLPENYY